MKENKLSKLERLAERAKLKAEQKRREVTRKLERQDGSIAALAWSADGTHIAVGGAAPEVTIYDAESGKRTASCEGHRAGIYAVAFSPDGQTLATGGFDGEVRLYRVATGDLAKAFIPVPIENLRSQK